MMTPDQIKKVLSSEQYIATQGGSEGVANYLNRLIKAVHDAQTTEECINRIHRWPTEKHIITQKVILDIITYTSLKRFLPIGSRLTLFKDHAQSGFTYYGALVPLIHEGVYLGITNITKPVGYALNSTVYPFEKKGLEEHRYLFSYDSAYAIETIIKNLSLLLHKNTQAVRPDWEPI
jgi:hypothetical protein